MPRIRLLHWKEEECAQRAAVLEGLGYTVDAARLVSSSMKEFRENPPDAVVIDLGRLPSHGREVGVFLRGSKSTRLIPLIFVEGEKEKVQRVMETLPDARFTSYSKIGPVLEDVLASAPLREAFVPKAPPAAPLLQKLGVKEGQGVRLVNAPQGFEKVVPVAKAGLTLWFVTSKKEYAVALPKMRAVAEEGGIWVIWPKTTKTAKPDINGNIVREMALGVGLVDFKICAVDEVWSGMRFAVRRS